MYKLSIIIPHYNSVEFLKKLLGSIPKCSDIQVIVVDDRSIKDLAELNNLKNDSKFSHVIFLENNRKEKGAGVCRNIGLKEAKGTWILFADADDFFLENFYDKVQVYFDSCYDVIFFTPTSIEMDTNKKSDRHLSYAELISNYSKEKSHRNILRLRYCFVVPWSKLVRRAFLVENKIKFDEVLASNDTMFSTRVGHLMKEFVVTKETIYCVTRSKGSLTTNVSSEVFNSRLKVHIDHCNFLRSNLNENDLILFELRGRGMLIKVIKYKLGLKKFMETYFELRRNRIKVFDFKLLNPYFAINKIIFHYKKQKNIKRHLTDVNLTEGNEENARNS